MRSIRLRSLVFVGSLFMPVNSPLIIAQETLNAETGPTGSPYRTIVERNAFGLRPPPPPPPPAQNVADQTKTDIKLTGITSYGNLKAYLMATDPKDKNKIEYYSLGVDEKKDGLEVMAIDEAAKSVRIRNAGTEALLTFATHGVTPAAVAVVPTPGTPGAVPGVPPVPGMNNPANAMSVTPGVAPARPISTPLRTIPSRPTRQTTSAYPTSAQSGMPAELQARYGLVQTPVANVPQPQPVHNTLSSEVQAVLMEAQRMANPNLPPTPGIPTPGDSAPGIPQLPRLPGY